MSSGEIVEFLKSVEFLSVLSEPDLARLAAAAESRNYELGDNIVDIGAPGEGLFVVRAGSVRKFTEEQGKQITMGICKERDVFSELAALREHQYEISARASARTSVIFIPRQALTPILERNKEARQFMVNLATISAAGGLVTQLFGLRGKVNQQELEEMIRSVGIKRVNAGQLILEQGSVNDRRLYLVRHGQIRIKYVEGNNELTLDTVDRGDVFGEKACLMHQAQLASAVAQTDAVLIVVPEKTVKLIIERNPKLKEILEDRIGFIDRELQRQKSLAERQSRPILVDIQSGARSGEHVLKRFPLVEQSAESDCGAACLAMICKHYAIPMSLGKLRELANVTTEGATLESLARVGESLGFATRGVQTTHAAMKGFELPFIAHWEGYHYVVVYGVSADHVWLADPAMGFRKLTVSEFDKGWNGTCLLFAPTDNLATEGVAKSPWMRFAAYLKPFRGLLGHLLMATLVVDILGLVPPVIVQNVLDQVVVHRDLDLLHVLIVGMVLAQVFTQVTSLVRAFLTNFMVRSLDFAMISHFYKHTLSLPYAFFMKRRTGEIFARFQENVTVRNFMTESTISTILNVLMLFVYLSILFMYNVKLTGLLMLMIVPIAVLTVVASPILRNYARRDFETSTAAESLLMETLSAIETVKATAMERAMRMQWERRYVKSLDVRYRAKKFDAMFGALGQILSGLTSVVVLWVGASLVLAQELTTGQLIAFNMLMGSVMSPLMGLIGLWQQVYGVGVAMERLGDVLDMEPEQKPDSVNTRIVLPNMRGDLRVENVFFRYGGNETPYVLENISLEAKAGEVIAIVGQSGSGKTTLAKLLVGFYPPTEGKVYVDDYEISLLDKEHFRSQLGYVMQNNLLFSGTVADNIALGEDNPDRRRIIEAAKLADAHGFINALPLKYEQPIGERGVGLSGGQIQRVCIARALYRDPRILILDEATSSLDAQSETNILRNMEAILKGRTAIIIAHRLSTVMQADKILVLYAGRIVEQGPHEQLLQEKGMYYQLVQKQVAAAR